MSTQHHNENVDIRVLSHPERTYGAADVQAVEKVVKHHLLLTQKYPMSHVIVKVNHKRDGSPESVIAHLAHAYTYTYETAKIEVDGKYQMKSLQISHDEAEEETYENEKYGAVNVDMVFATPVPEIPTAMAAVNFAYNVAIANGYSAMRLIGAQANIENYKRYLAGNLKAFGSVGHGSTTGILLSDGSLTYKWFESLAGTALNPEVIYFNSCDVFNPPLEPSIMQAGARTFIGGRIPLLIGSSEEVFKCFWKNILPNIQPMGTALRQCEAMHYPVPNAHGIAGDQGNFS
ncbi:MAG: hypothetical protein PVH88_26290 [Ignavibacteria bacterium]|jgi:hypothetical protein